MAISKGHHGSRRNSGSGGKDKFTKGYKWLLLGNIT